MATPSGQSADCKNESWAHPALMKVTHGGEFVETDLPESLAEELSGRLPPLPLSQAVTEQTGVALHRVRLLEDAVHKVVGVDVVLDEAVEGDLQLGGKGQQNPAEQKRRKLVSIS